MQLSTEHFPIVYKALGSALRNRGAKESLKTVCVSFLLSAVIKLGPQPFYRRKGLLDLHFHLSLKEFIIEGIQSRS